MSDMKHTPEPWCLGEETQIIAATSDQLNSGFCVAKCQGPDASPNSIRIVACVNACHGIHTETLENVPTFGQIAIESRDEFLAIKAQRDQLMDMLAEVMEIDSDAEFMRLEKEMKVLPYSEETKAAHLMFDAYSKVKAVMK